MCLTKVIKKIDVRLATKEEFEGYKFLMPTGLGGYETPMKGNQRTFPEGRWVNEEKYRPTYAHSRMIKLFRPFGRTPTEYRQGFHIFRTIEGARAWGKFLYPLFKVKYRKVVAEGVQDDSEVDVALEMKLLGQVKGKNT